MKIVDKFLKVLRIFGEKGQASTEEAISGTGTFGTGTELIGEEKSLKDGEDNCPYCKSKRFFRRGKRKKKLEIVQLYQCKECNRTFTSQFSKGWHYPVNLIIDGLSYYNLGFGLEDTCRIIKQKFGVNPGASTLANWIRRYADLCRYERLRPFATKMCKPQDTIEVMNMAHRQIYRFLYHRPKMRLTLQEFKNRHFEPLKEYLDGVSSETPHQYFQEGVRISEIKTKFDKSQMIVRAKQNYANRLASFVLQTVKDRKKRHEILQQFFVANDSVSVASEVPVYIRKEDIEHMENVLKFKVLDGATMEIRGRAGRPGSEVAGTKTGPEGSSQQQSTSARGRSISAAEGLPRLLTGHIDLLQVRNGQIHILDYKPNAAKEKPIEQLTWYALALSRLTGLRLFEFKCAWFDEKDYFEFFPLHVVKKLQDKKRKKKVYLKAYGTSVEVPEENRIKVV